MMMRSFFMAALVFAMIFQVPSIAMGGGKTTATLQTFTGEITETLCPKNHDDMMKEMKNMRMDKLTCEKTCIQMGAKYALYDAEKDQVYRLDDRGKIEPFAGRKVRIVGSLKKNTITVETVEAAN
jgi:hypothetical protein